MRAWPYLALALTVPLLLGMGDKPKAAAVAAPVVTLSANPATVASGGSSTLTWSSTGASSCTMAAAGQSASVSTSGSVGTGPITASLTVTLTCTGAGGSDAESVTVTVAAAPPPPPPEPPAPPPEPPAPPPPPPEPPAPPSSSALYLSPGGSDSGSCTEAAPCKTFARAFGLLKAGGELVLLDGAYGVSKGTGAISYYGAGSAQPPSGTASQATRVRAKNPGAVTVEGPACTSEPGCRGLFIGRVARKDSRITIEGITFVGGASLYNADYVTLKNVGVNGPLSVGTNDHTQGANYNLIEDVWVWASGVRIIAINYRANYNVWRRVIVRGDGCGTSACSGEGNPNVGITIYDSHDVSYQNVVVVDRVLKSGDTPYANFACASHSGQTFPFGRNEWLGIISKNAPDAGLYCEPDGGTTIAGAPPFRIEGAVMWGNAGLGVNIQREAARAIIRNVTTDTGLRLQPISTAGIVLEGVTAKSINSAVPCSGCSTSVPAAPPSVTRYGVDGSRYGEAGYNAPQATSLWPWPNQDRIKAEMCAVATRGFCGSSLTEYLR